MVIVKSKLVKDYMKSPSISKHSLQTIYDLIVDDLQLVQIRCNECNQCGFVVHGYYDRRLKRCLKNGESSARITILRIRCTHCGKTHAVLLSSMIPYSQLSVEDSISIIELEHNCQINSFLDEHYWIETDDVFNTRKKFRHYWKERLLSSRLFLHMENLTESCIEQFRLQFMQIRCRSIFFLSSST